MPLDGASDVVEPSPEFWDLFRPVILDAIGDVQVNGVTGATGPVGPSGPTGVSGATGPAGPTGPSGVVGPSGSVGPSGATGPAGPTGIAGPTGVTGAVGATGNAGSAGSTGPVGATGPTGVTGVTGDAGSAGPLGATGPVGPTGVTGGVGATGATGPSGGSEIVSAILSTNFSIPVAWASVPNWQIVVPANSGPCDIEVKGGPLCNISTGTNAAGTAFALSLRIMDELGNLVAYAGATIFSSSAVAQNWVLPLTLAEPIANSGIDKTYHVEAQMTKSAVASAFSNLFTSQAGFKDPVLRAVRR